MGTYGGSATLTYGQLFSDNTYGSFGDAATIRPSVAATEPVEVYIADLMTGTKIGDVLPATALRWTEQINAPGGFSVTLPWDQPYLSQRTAGQSLFTYGTQGALTYGELFPAGAYGDLGALIGAAIPSQAPFDADGLGVWFASGDLVLYGGVVTEIRETVGTEGVTTYEAGGQGFWSLFASGVRTVESDLGMTSGHVVLTESGYRIRWVKDTDVFLVVHDLFQHVNATSAATFPLSIEMLGPDPGGVSGVLLPDDLDVATGQSIAELVQDLAGASPGFDFGFSYRWAGQNQFGVVLELNAPVRGSTTRHVLDLGGLVTTASLTRSPLTVANRVWVLGKDAQGFADAPEMRFPIGRYPFMQKSIDRSKITSPGLLNAMAAGELARCRVPAQVLTVTMPDSGTMPLGSYIAGDYVAVDVHSGPVNCDGIWRIITINVARDEAGEASVTIELNPADGPQPVRGPAARFRADLAEARRLRDDLNQPR